jgi:hypothetical protein
MQVERIPSVITYSPTTTHLESPWGSPCSSDAITMLNTKLELHVEDLSTELDLMLNTLNAMTDSSLQQIYEKAVSSASVCRNAEEIVTDYLTQLFDYLSQSSVEFERILSGSIPADFVFTIPAVHI